MSDTATRSPSAKAQVTLSRETIHNPDEPRHFMRIKPVKGEVRVLLDGRVLAVSRLAVRVLEAGRDLYDPVFYLPPGDVKADLVPVEKRTYCPLKGHASYFDLAPAEDRPAAREIAWSYRDTHAFAKELNGLIAFDAGRVSFEEHPPTA